MAKKTKDSNLSIEERLEQALIPNWDEPYKLPDNWCWINLKSVLQHQSGNSKLIKGKLESEKKDGLYDAYSASGQDVYTASYEHEGDAIIVSAVGARCGKAFLAKGKWSAIANTHIIYTNDKLIDIRYLYYILNDEFWWVKRGNAQPFIVVNESLSKPFALPPLNEQHRIVAQVESLFAKLDEAKEKAQEVVAGFETRKAAILHKAFSGELTAKWREENNVSNNTWVTKSLGDVCKSIYDGDHMPPPKSESGIPFLVISNVNTGYLSFEDTRFVPNEYYDNITDTRKPQNGDVLYTLVGSYGIPVVVDANKAFCFQRHMALLKPLSVDTYFLWYLLQTQEMYQKATAIAKGVAQLTVPIKGLRAMEFSCPTSEEQQEIVRLLDIMVKKELCAKEIAETVIEQIDTMKKAILARAFRGKLGTNDPSEESAKALIKQVLEERIKTQELELKRTPKKKKEVLIVAKTILETLKSAEKLTPEKLKAETGLKIDDFYDQLKVLIDNEQIREMRIDGESYLEAVL